jgi:hypothetical protein
VHDVAQLLVAQAALGAGIDDRADPLAAEVGVHDGQLAVAATRRHHDHPAGLVHVVAAAQDLQLLALEVEDQALALQPVDAQHAVHLRPLDRQCRGADVLAVARADLQPVQHHHRALLDADDRVHSGCLAGLQVQPLHQPVGNAADVGAGIQEEVEGPLTVDGDRCKHVLVAVLVGGERGGRAVLVRKLDLRGADLSGRRRLGQCARGARDGAGRGQHPESGVPAGRRHAPSPPLCRCCDNITVR